MSVIIETTVGDLVIDLYVDEREKTCFNFIKLCKLKHYNYALFLFVKRNFIAQIADADGRNTGGSSVFAHMYGEQAALFEGEKMPRLKHTVTGTVSMLAKDNKVGSQFFITLSDGLTYLDSEHIVFGKVVEGLDTLMKINNSIVDDDSRPYQDIRISHTIVLEDPFGDPDDLQFPSRSPSPTRELIESDRIGLEMEIEQEASKTVEQLTEELEVKEAKAQAQMLEIIGDIPDADIKPDENVLFVCKLNQVTTSEDLMVIFSRFGQILSCEVIRDKKTNDSLQYAFIEFENKEDCERAYFKMDNVLIDDKRIHVDFSQSVAKVQWKQFQQQRKRKVSTNNELVSKKERISRNEQHKDDDYHSNHKKHKSDHHRSSYSDSKHSKHKRHYRNSPERAHRYSRDEFSSRTRHKDHKRKHSSRH